MKCNYFTNLKCNFITNACEEDGKIFYRQHQTMNSVRKYIKQIKAKRNIKMVFVYKVENGIRNNNPFIIDYKNYGGN